MSTVPDEIPVISTTNETTTELDELSKKNELVHQLSEDAAGDSGLAIVNQSSDTPFGSTSPPLAAIATPRTPRSYPNDGTASPHSPWSGSTSPSRLPLRSHSPALLSPASSLIFERNVQESTIPDDCSGAIPSHIQTDDQIPPVLEASSIAITTEGLDPSDVEIVTHSAHLPAAVTVVASTSHGDLPLSPALSTHQCSELADSTLAEDPRSSPAPSYGNLDATDVRRLSFISFADVVHGEHAETEAQLAASGYLPSSPGRNQSPSPVGSPGPSSYMHKPFGTSPESSIRGIPFPNSKSPPLPLSPTGLGRSGSPVPGELHMEKMSEALKAVENAELHENTTR
jgi:hypothetical protein